MNKKNESSDISGEEDRAKESIDRKSNTDRFIFLVICFILFSFFEGLNDFMEKSSVSQSVTVDANGKIQENIGLSVNRKSETLSDLKEYSDGIEKINSEDWKGALLDFKKYKSDGGQSIYADYFIGYCMRRPLGKTRLETYEFIEAFNNLKNFLENTKSGSSQFRIYAGTEIMDLAAKSHDLTRQEQALDYLYKLEKELPTKDYDDEKKFAEAGYLLMFKIVQAIQSKHSINTEQCINLYDQLLEPIGRIDITDDPIILKNYFWFYREEIERNIASKNLENARNLWSKLTGNIKYENGIYDKNDKEKLDNFLIRIRKKYNW